MRSSSYLKQMQPPLSSCCADAAATKQLLRFNAVQESLAAQVRGTGTSVHLTSPGMLATDLLAARSVVTVASVID